MLWATGYLCDFLSVERFDSDCGRMYALRGVPCGVVCDMSLTRVVVHVISSLVSGNDVFACPSVAQLTMFTASEGKH